MSAACARSRSSGSVTAGVQKQKIRTHHQQIRSVSGLVVKSIVAIDGPRVRFAADAFQNYIFLHFTCRLLDELHRGLHFFFPFMMALIHFLLGGGGRTVDTFLSYLLPRITMCYLSRTTTHFLCFWFCATMRDCLAAALELTLTACL